MQLPSGVALRAIVPDDEPFLRVLYASTREEEIALTGWSREEIEGFLRMQYDAQTRHYTTHFVGARWDLVLIDGEPAGRLLVLRLPDEEHVIDIALLTAHRNRGIGTALLAGVCEGADRASLMTSIYVEHLNPARRLYERLGFREVLDNGVYVRMERPPRRDAVQPKMAS